MGSLGIARLTDLLDFVRLEDDICTERFLKEDPITMLNDRSSSSWTGHIVESGVIRYHPETIRAAERRTANSLMHLEQRIAGVERAAMSVSRPFALKLGEILLISNHRALHCRGECTVLFRDFPTGFDSRRVSVLHAVRERPGQ